MMWCLRMIRDLVAGHEPLRDVDVVRVAQGCEVGHLDGTAIRVLPLSEELVDGVDGVRLHRIVTNECKI